MRFLLAALLILAPGLALAHSELSGSTPPQGARLAAPPGEFVLRFNEPVQVTSLRLFDAAGQALPLQREGDAAPRREARATPAAPLPPGALRLEWRAISADGHPIRGSLRFTWEATR
ncbi:copper resistance CopC family protein [Sediminicoccus rosea]|jgi:methionine-rich copper-binding protein CopC|uniref:Copper resistance protein CopC n=1 Tax=Sediminicoccus rosea TaxID=1225128 RepID=A0ABZ0PNP9_9PROT|nr:copper resistance protein CopC [Sediminicoccus rosea]WPB87324.1 copper resistance protein CopC [Sediminicoccus rosea]